jgi:hypothetical protein
MIGHLLTVRIECPAPKCLLGAESRMTLPERQSTIVPAIGEPPSGPRNRRWAGVAAPQNDSLMRCFYEWSLCGSLGLESVPMTPRELENAFDEIMQQHRGGQDADAMRKIAALLKPVMGLTGYTDEMAEGLQNAAERLYGKTAGIPVHQQQRHEFRAAVHRLKNGMDMMHDQLPPEFRQRD